MLSLVTLYYIELQFQLKAVWNRCFFFNGFTMLSVNIVCLNEMSAIVGSSVLPCAAISAERIPPVNN